MALLVLLLVDTYAKILPIASHLFADITEFMRRCKSILSQENRSLILIRMMVIVTDRLIDTTLLTILIGHNNW